MLQPITEKCNKVACNKTLLSENKKSIKSKVKSIILIAIVK